MDLWPVYFSSGYIKSRKIHLNLSAHAAHMSLPSLQHNVLSPVLMLLLNSYSLIILQQRSWRCCFSIKSAVSDLSIHHLYSTCFTQQRVCRSASEITINNVQPCQLRRRQQFTKAGLFHRPRRSLLSPCYCICSDTLQVDFTNADDQTNHFTDS